jgi:hypothetical protein
MKNERKLRLVQPPPSEGGSAPTPPGGGGDEPPFSEEELRDAARLRDAIERGDDPVSSSLRAAWKPTELEEPDFEALLARGLGSTEELGGAAPSGPHEAPAAPAERAAADRLRAALELRDGGRKPAPGADATAGEQTASIDLAVALRAAWRPAPLDPLRNELLIAGGLRRLKRRSPVLTVVSIAVTITALAAGFALIVRPDGGRDAAERTAQVAHAPLIPARSTTALFDVAEPFPRTGGESKRIDRIATARAVDLRANRFSKWGVR